VQKYTKIEAVQIVGRAGHSVLYDVQSGGKLHNVGWEDPYAGQSLRGQAGYAFDEETNLTLCPIGT
jgi:hypothetical protein